MERQTSLLNVVRDVLGGRLGLGGYKSASDNGSRSEKSVREPVSPPVSPETWCPLYRELAGSPCLTAASSGSPFSGASLGGRALRWFRGRLWGFHRKRGVCVSCLCLDRWLGKASCSALSSLPVDLSSGFFHARFRPDVPSPMAASGSSVRRLSIVASVSRSPGSPLPDFTGNVVCVSRTSVAEFHLTTR